MSFPGSRHRHRHAVPLYQPQTWERSLYMSYRAQKKKKKKNMVQETLFLVAKHLKPNRHHDDNSKSTPAMTSRMPVSAHQAQCTPFVMHPTQEQTPNPRQTPLLHPSTLTTRNPKPVSQRNSGNSCRIFTGPGRRHARRHVHTHPRPEKE